MAALSWLRNIADLTCLDMELHEARHAAQNQSFWGLFALHSTVYSLGCMFIYWSGCSSELILL